jgi:hypothetical protein
LSSSSSRQEELNVVCRIGILLAAHAETKGWASKSHDDSAVLFNPSELLFLTPSCSWLLFSCRPSTAATPPGSA